MRFRPDIKPPMWGPPSAVARAVREHYESQRGIAVPLVFFPFWRGGLNYGSLSSLTYTMAAGCVEDGEGLNTATSGAYIPSPAGLKVPEITISLNVRFNSIGVNSRILEMEYSNVSIAPYVSWGFEGHTANQIRFLAATSEDYVGGRILVTVPVGPMVSIAGRSSITSGRSVFLNGAAAGVNTIGLGSLIYSAANYPVDIGYFSPGGANKSNLNIACAKIFGSALSDAQIIEDQATPYAPLMPYSPPVYFDLAASGGATLEAGAITTAAPTIGSTTLGQIHALTAGAIATGAPVLGSPTIGQIHALTGQGITTGTVAIGTPTLGQIHNLTASGITTGQPAVGAPTIITGGVNILEAAGITARAPTIGTPALGQVHALSASSVQTGAPVVGSPAIGQIHALSASGVTAGTPQVGTPTLTIPVFVLEALSILAGQPTIGTPVLGQIHALVAADITAGIPTIGSPAVDAAILQAIGILSIVNITPVLTISDITPQLTIGAN